MCAQYISHKNFKLVQESAARILPLGSHLGSYVGIFWGGRHQSVRLDVINRNRWSPSLGAPIGTMPAVCAAIFRDNPFVIVARDNWVLTIENGQEQDLAIGFDTCSGTLRTRRAYPSFPVQ
jgi:hypothetical protein